jgi:hypothetical protein
MWNFFLLSCPQADTLRTWSVLYCLSGWPTDAIAFALKNHFTIDDSESDELHDFRDAVSEMAWSLVVHSNAKIRTFSGTILALLAESSGCHCFKLLLVEIVVKYWTLGKRILPEQLKIFNMEI